MWKRRWGVATSPKDKVQMHPNIGFVRFDEGLRDKEIRMERFRSLLSVLEKIQTDKVSLSDLLRTLGLSVRKLRVGHFTNWAPVKLQCPAKHIISISNQISVLKSKSSKLKSDETEIMLTESTS